MTYKSSRPIKNRHLMFAFVGVSLVVLAIVLLALVGIIHPFKKKVALSAGQYTKGEAAQTKGGKSVAGGKPPINNSSSSSNQNVPNYSQKNTGNSGSVALTAPSGDFVSNHHPSLSGSSSPNTESSVCTSTPGATCRIDFTKDGYTKSLPSQTTDSGGSVYWDWKLQDYGLTSGAWKITAVASLNGQSISTSDSMDLVVSP